MFIRNSWYAAALSSDLVANRPLARVVIGDPLVLFRTTDHSAAVLRDCCCHRHMPLSRGRCEGDFLRCMYHGLKFDASGACVEVPGQQDIAEHFNVRAYPAIERAGWLWVWMGHPQRADTRLLPVPSGFDSSHWAMRYGQMALNAGYTLVNDNLCDFSHTAYVHENTFAGGLLTFSQTHPRITTLERGIRVERWLSDRQLAETWLNDTPEGARTPVDRHDQWIAYDYLAPGAMIMQVQMHRAGTAQEHGFDAPHVAPIHANIGIHVVTPVTEETCRYFFSLGPRFSEAAEAPGLADEMFKAALGGFEEDRAVLEAQQRNLRWAQKPPLTIRHDRGVLLMRSIMQRLLTEEAVSSDEPVT